MKQYIDNFSTFIKTYRKEKKLTQEDLAEELGYSAKNIAKWEQGKSLPTLDTAIQISLLTDVPIDNFLGVLNAKKNLDLNYWIKEYLRTHKIKNTKVVYNLKEYLIKIKELENKGYTEKFKEKQRRELDASLKTEVLTKEGYLEFKFNEFVLDTKILNDNKFQIKNSEDCVEVLQMLNFNNVVVVEEDTYKTNHIVFDANEKFCFYYYTIQKEKIKNDIKQIQKEKSLAILIDELKKLQNKESEHKQNLASLEKWYKSLCNFKIEII